MTNDPYTYYAFGFDIESAIALPELSAADGQPSLGIIRVSLCDLSADWAALAKPEEYWVLGRQQLMFKADDVGLFRISNGDTIELMPFPGAEDGRLRLYLLGTAIGILLLQRGILPLHGSAVAVGGKAYAVVGHSGAGKSTLASALAGLGCKLLSDDVIPVVTTGTVPLAYPAYPQQKLWQESLNELGMASSGYVPIFNRETKFVIPVRANFQPEPLPLAGVFELVKSDNGPAFQPIQGMERFHMLLKHTYRQFLVKELGMMEWHFGTLAKLLGAVDCYRLNRRTSGFSAPDLASAIIDTIHQGDSIHAYG